MAGGLGGRHRDGRGGAVGVQAKDPRRGTRRPHGPGRRGHVPAAIEVRRPQTIAEPAGHLRASDNAGHQLLTANPGDLRRRQRSGHDRRARMQEAREIGVVVVLDMRGQSVDKSRHRVSNGNCVDLPGRRHGRGREPCTYPAKKIVYIQYVNPTVEAKPKRGRILRLSDMAAAHVRELIVSGQLRAGEFIRPETVAEDLGISATPAREGLLQLQTEGFLTVEPRRGFTVTALSSEDVRDIYDAQALLGGELTARAARVIGPDLVNELERIQADLEKAATDRDYDAVERLNHRFHETIYRLAGSRKIRWLIKNTLAYAPRKFFAAVEGWPEASAQDHRAIIEHLRANDADQARATMAHHIHKAGMLLADHLAAQGTSG